MTEDLVRQCSTSVMETFHTMIRSVGAEARKRSASELSFQQFRAMKTIEQHSGASLSLVSEHLGATLSASSKLIDGLVDRGLVCRETAEDDRRRLILALTEAGERAIDSVHMEQVSCLAERLTVLSPSECRMLALAMDVLRSALVSTPVSTTGQMQVVK